MEQDIQASQTDPLFHGSELINASTQSVTAQEGCYAGKSTFFVLEALLLDVIAGAPGVHHAVVADASTISSELEAIVKRPRSPSSKNLLLPEPNPSISEELENRGVQLMKRRKISSSPCSEIAFDEPQSRSVSPSWLYLRNEEIKVSEDRAEHVSTPCSCMDDDLSGDTICKRPPYTSMSLVSYDSEDNDRLADVSMPCPYCDDDYNVQTIDTEATKEAETDRFEVKRILAHQKRGSYVFFCVEWKGYSELTWEPADHLDNCAEVLEDYWNTLPIDSQ
jgi:sarcosine oxidase delta subunit